jgi:formylglycine-generating enzyme required for sulfatase activity
VSACCSPGGGRGVAHAAPAAAPGVTRSKAPELVELDGGTFWMGCDRGEGHPHDREAPVREVEVSPFAMAACAVTNREFAAFVDDTGYVTDAERFGWSFVFADFVAPDATIVGHAGGVPWWIGVKGAVWSHPLGPASSPKGLEEHPVVHVSWQDANAYCAWAGVRLATEVEWECAARGGLDRARFPWGDELRPDGSWRCNIWQGAFPRTNTLKDGWHGTAPVRTYEPNGFGLYQTVGNVWEWCADGFVPGDDARRVIRGGSYLCHDSYCNRYRVAARSSNTPDSSGGNLGFRVARDH